MIYETYDAFAESLLTQSRRRQLHTTTERLSFLIFSCNLSEMEARRIEQVANSYSDYSCLIEGENIPNLESERLY